MRVLHILHQYLPDHVGGTEHYVRSLALAQQEAGLQVAVFCRRSAPGRTLETESPDGIPVYRAVRGRFTPVGRWRATFGDRFLARTIQQVIRGTSPDLIHIHHLMGLPVDAVRTAIPEVPIVVTLHDYWWVCANAQLITDFDGSVCAGPRYWLNCAHCGLARAGTGALWPLAPLFVPFFAWRGLLLRRLAGRVAAWIAPTHFVGQWHGAHGLSANRMHVIEHGLTPPAELPCPTSQPDDQPVAHLLYIGGLSPQKGVHVLVDAFNAMPQPAQLTIAGDEAVFPDYCATLHSRAQHPGIRFVGRLDREGVWRTLARATCLVVPSLWYETSSLVVQEAFAMRTPVIAAAHGALAERVHHEVDGLLVPPGDVAALRRALARIVDEPGLVARLRAGIRPVTSMAQHLQELDRLYRSALGEFTSDVDPDSGRSALRHLEGSGRSHG